MQSPSGPRRKPTHRGAVLREKRALSVEMAARLGKALGTTAESWIAMQTALDLWEIAQDPDALADVHPVEAA